MIHAVDVCAGIGGLALGLELAGCRIVGLVERDERCRAELALHWPDVPIRPDLCALGDDDIAAFGRVDLLSGGIPCQPWSVAGQRKGHEDERDLWPDFRDLARRTGARLLLVENVPGLASAELGLARVLADMEADGFEACPVQVHAAAVGAPHLRARLFICASRNLAEAEHSRCQGRDAQWRRSGATLPRSEEADPCALADGDGNGQHRQSDAGLQLQRQDQRVHDADRCGEPMPWADAVWLDCLDGKQRRIPSELAFYPLAHGTPGRVARLRALGNAVVPAQVAKVARAMIEAAA